MKIKAAVFDIDGTLVARGQKAPSTATAEAVKALAKQGVKIIIATGRARFTAQAVLGKSVKADYYVTVNGAHVTDAAGAGMWQNRMTPEEMYVLVDFCEDYDLPLEFIFEDAYYAYVEYPTLYRHLKAYREMLPYLKDGEDQVRHLEDMPFGACAAMNEQRMQEFVQKYGYLGLQMVSFAPGHYDISSPKTNKKASVSRLLEQLGITWQETAAFGDSENDAELLQAAGFAVAMENGDECVKKQADVIAPNAAQEGVAQVINKYLLQQEA